MNRLPAHLDDDGISSKDCSREGVEHIVERVIPWNNRTHLCIRVHGWHEVSRQVESNME